MSNHPTSPLLPAGSSARCLNCGYALRALTEPRCPECGRPFDPRDPTTYAGEAELKKWRLFLAPPGRLMHGAALVIAAILIVDAAWPGDFACAAVPAALAGLLLIATWLVGAVICFGFARRRKRGLATDDIAWRQWLKLPVITAVTIVVLWFGLPLRLTFWVSRSAMDAFAARAMQAPVGSHLPDTWVGLFRARDVWRTQKGVQFLVRSAGLVDQEGWACSPNGPPAATKDDTYTHFAGSWYLRHWRF